MSEWQPIETAPQDGTAIQAKIPGNGSDNIIAWTDGLLDSDERPCGGWQFVEDQEPPDDWTDGICWALNEDGKSSTKPTQWKRLPKPPKHQENTIATMSCQDTMESKT